MDTKRPNIILITADSLRAAHLGCYGYAKPTSPNLDRFARENAVFPNAFSDGPNTPHAFPAIMASRHSLISGKLGLFDAPVTLAEVLKSAGYKTLGFNAANPYVSRFFHYDRGFDEFHDYLDFSIPTENSGQHNGKSRLETGLDVPDVDLDRYLISDETIHAKASLEARMNQDCFDAINRNLKHPFFLWIHYMDTHFPYLPQPPSQIEIGIDPVSKAENFKLNTRVRENMPLSPDGLARLVQLYDASVRQLDSKVGELLRFLHTQDLYESSMIVFSADHGEEFKDHGDLQHRSKLFDELIHVPLLIKKPQKRNSHVNEELVSLMALAPTILSSAGIANVFAAGGIFDGVPVTSETDFPHVFSGASYQGDNATPVDGNLLRTNTLPRIHSCREGHWKLIVDAGRDEKLLFNLIADPLETENLFKQEKHAAARLGQKLSEHVSNLEKRGLESKIARVRKKMSAKLQDTHAVRPPS